ncbi:choice-of-anchor D domain-containing protein [Jiulongibacter sp. NS-SX5]|uniref:choice-of-anchor D domain-containing protein n=1 Tax=Jiulongibacter sp. NS-SX5 TaxID=3463854 RepID=UPI00405949BE
MRKLYLIFLFIFVAFTSFSQYADDPQSSTLLGKKKGSSTATISSGCTGSELATPYDGDNGQRGIMFDVVADDTLTINHFDASLYVGTTANYEIYYRPGSFVGHDADSTGWTLIGSVENLTSSGDNVPTHLPIPINLTIPAGERYAFYITNSDYVGGIRYTDAAGTAPGDTLISDSNLTIFEGYGKLYPFGISIGARRFNGTICYSLGTSTSSCASVATATEDMTWYGSVSTDWNNACNWSPNGLPSATNNIVIPSGTPFQAIVNVNNAVANSVEIQHNANFTIASTGVLTINGFKSVGIPSSNTSFYNEGVFTNNGLLNIGTGGSAGSYGINNEEDITNNAGAVIRIENTTSIGLRNDAFSEFNNLGEVSIGRNSAVGSIGFNNRGELLNTGGTIGIDNSTLYGFDNGVGNVTNTGSITIGRNASVGDYGFFNGGELINSSTGVLTIDSSNTEGFRGFGSGDILNSGLIEIGKNNAVGTTAISTSDEFINNECGQILIFQGVFDISTNDEVINRGYFFVNNDIENSGTFTNKGTFKYATFSGSGSFTNTTDSAVVINDAIPIFTYGGTFNGTIDGIFTNNLATISAGSFTAPNTFTANGSLPVGTQTLYAKITPIGGACTHIVPFNFNNSPEINLQGNGQNITDGANSPSLSDSTDFGTINVASGSNTNTFTIENTGGATLNITSITSSGAHGSEFVVSNIPTTISASGTATFDVTFDPAAVGLKTATITVNNNDSDEAVYDFAVQGNGVIPCTSPSVPTITYSPSTVCTGSTATLNIAGSLNDATNWHIYTGSCGGTQVGTTNSSTFEVTPSSPSTIYYIRGEGGCVTPSSCGSVIVNVTSTDDAGFSYSSSSYCTYSSDPLPTITGINGGTFSASPAGLSLNPSSGQIDLSASTPNTYNVTYTTAGSCTNSSSVSVTINAPPTPSITGSDNLTCAVTSVTRTVSGGNSYSWSGPSAYSASTAQATITSAGTYTVTVTGTNGCTATATTVVTLDGTAPTPYISGTDNLTCAVSSVTRTASGGNSYSWSGPSAYSASTAQATITAAGTYTVTVTATNGCTATATTVVTLDGTPPSPSISGTNNLTCAVTSVTRTASGGTSYSWSGPSAYSASTAQATITAAGTYTVTVTGTNGCTATATTVVTLDGTPPTPLISGTDNLTCAVTSVIRTASGGISYSWSGPSAYSASTAQATITAAGTYTVTVTGTNGCTATATTVVTLDGTPPTPSISGTNNLTCAVTSVTRTASGGTSYSWSGPSAYSASTAQATITAAGTYTVTVTGTNGCTATATTVITLDGTPPTPSISGTNNLTCAVTSVTRTASGGTSYSWSGPSAYSASTAQATITAAGTYTVTVTATNGCTATATTVVTLDGTPPTPSISGTDNLTCAVTSVTRTASGGTSYSWSGPSAYSASTAQATITVSGTYTVTVTGTNGCTATATTVVTLDGTPPTPSISGTDNLTCAVTSVTRTASGGTSYSWSGPSAFSASTAQATITAAGTYTVTVTGTNGCTATATTVVTLDGTPPTPSISGTNNLTCAVTSVTRTASGGTSYSWSGPSAYSVSTAQATITAAGTYTVTVTATNGCTATATTVVTLDGTPPTPSISGTNNLTCAVTSVTRTASGGTSYSWSGPSAFSASTAQATITAAGTYTVTVAGTNGCTATASTVVTLDGTPPTPSITGSDNLTCSVTSVTRTASGGNSYSWSGPSGYSASTAQATITAAGTYTVTLTGTNGCTATATTVVTLESTPPTPSISGTNNLTCAVTSVTRTASGGTSYSWSGPSAFSASTAQASITSAGTYTVTVTGTNGCTATATTVVTLDGTPSTPSISGTDNLTCAVTSVTRTASGGNSYSWSGPSAYSASTAQATITAAGTYTVTVTGTNGCTATATTVVTLDGTPPTPSISGTNNLTCAVTSVTRTASGGTSYSWSGPSAYSASTAQATITAAGTYTVTVTGTNGCTATATTVVTADETPQTIGVTSYERPSACGLNDASITFSTSLPDGSYTLGYTRNSITSSAAVTVSSGSFVLSNLQPGLYSAFSISSGLCSANSSAEVDIVSIPLNVTASNGGPYVEGETVQLTGTGGPTYNWSGPNGFSSSLQNPPVTNATTADAGTYTLTVVNGACTATATTVVSIQNATPAFSYYYAYGGANPEIIAPLTQNAEFQISDRPVTILAVPNVTVASTRLQLSGTSNLQYFEDNQAPYSLYEANNMATGDYLGTNFYTFIARGYDQPNNQGNIILGPDVIGFWVVNGQRSINLTEPSATALCAQGSFNVYFSTTGTFEAGNNFIVYLSDANGYFTNPTQIGSGSGNSIACTLPATITSGTGYRIKVVSTSPIVNSEISASAFSIIGTNALLTSPNDDLISQTKDFKAVQTIEARNQISGNGQSDYRSGNSILLKPGFKADSGTVFEAKIQNVCP